MLKNRMKAYWNSGNILAFLTGCSYATISIIVFVAGNSKGLLCSNLVGFEARLFAGMFFVFGLWLMSTVFGNKYNKDISWPTGIIVLMAGPLLQLLARQIAHFLGK
jgi:hypothetical protein